MNSSKGLGLEGKTLLIVHAGSSRKKFILQKIKKMGMTIILLNAKEQAWAKPYVDYWITTDLSDNKEVVRRINAFKNEHPDVKIDGILTYWEESLLLTSKLIDSYNMVGASYDVAQKARNKVLFRKFCEANDIISPKSKLVRKKEDLKKVIKELNFPMVIKPVYGSSGAFVIMVEDEDELKKTYDYISSSLPNHEDAHEWESLDLIAEEYIDGDEIDIDIVLQNGKMKFFSIADIKRSDEPFFLEIGKSIPSILADSDQQEIVDFAEMLLEKMGVQNGCVHVEALHTKKGVVPIEVNLRLGGYETYSFVKKAWHVDLIEAAAKIALGQYVPKVKKPEEPYENLIGEYLLPEYSGAMVQWDINPKFEKNKYLEEFTVFKKIGDTVLVPPEGYEYLGWMAASGDSIPDAQDNLDELKELVKYEIARFHPASSIGKTARKNHFSASWINKEAIARAARIEKIRRMSIRNQRNLHIGIACNTYNESEVSAVERDLMNIGKTIEKTLLDRGYRVSFFDFNNLQKAFNDLKSSDVDMVFNVCERINDSSLLEPHAASILDTLQIPYTGSSPFTLGLCIDKIRVKKLLAFHNIPTPKWDYAYSLDDDLRDDLKYPLIVKPSNTDNSIGITNDSVVTNKKELQRQLEMVMIDLRRPVLIEEYIEGDEYDVSILGSEDDDLRVLPLSRSIFDKMPAGFWHIYPFEAKWDEGTAYDKIVVQRPPKNIPVKLSSLISEIALDTYNILDCHDYGRVELRVDKNNNPYILELNPNPSIMSGDAVPASAELVGMDYGDFLEEIIRMAIKRYKDHPPYYHLQSNFM